MPRHSVAAGCDTKSGMATAYTDFPKTRSCKRNGSQQLSDKEATGMAHHQVHIVFKTLQRPLLCYRGCSLSRVNGRSCFKATEA